MFSIICFCLIEKNIKEDVPPKHRAYNTSLAHFSDQCRFGVGPV